MAYPFDQLGLFLPTTDVYDTQIIEDIEINSDSFREFLVRLRQSINNVAIVVNLKDTGIYTTEEFVCGQVYFPDPSLTSLSPTTPEPRGVFRKTIICSALPNTGTSLTPHLIPVSSNYTWTRIYGTATDPIGLSGLPLPYASPTLADNVALEVSATDIIITTGSNRSSYTTVLVTVEYLQN